MSWTFEPHPDDAARRVAQAAPVASATASQRVSPQLEPAAASRPWLRREAVVIAPRADTREAVVLELLPLAAPILAYGASQLFIPWGLPLVAGSIFVAMFAAFVYAIRDTSALTSRRFEQLPPASLALASPILYLAVRGRMLVSIDKSAYNPLPWAIGSTVVAIGLFLVLNVFEGAVAEGEQSLMNLLG